MSHDHTVPEGWMRGEKLIIVPYDIKVHWPYPYGLEREVDQSVRAWTPNKPYAVHGITFDNKQDMDSFLAWWYDNLKSTLTFARFREANKTRCLKWHPQGINSWSTSDWITAIVGELGELASLIKMRNRERDGLPGNKFSPTDKQVADEIADVLTYLDLLAVSLNVDLAEAVVSKFNEVSIRVGFPDRL